MENFISLIFDGGHGKRCQVVNSLKSLCIPWNCRTLTNITKGTRLTGMDEIHGLFPIPYLLWTFINKLQCMFSKHSTGKYNLFISWIKRNLTVTQLRHKENNILYLPLINITAIFQTYHTDWKSIDWQIAQETLIK